MSRPEVIPPYLYLRNGRVSNGEGYFFLVYVHVVDLNNAVPTLELFLVSTVSVLLALAVELHAVWILKGAGTARTYRVGVSFVRVDVISALFLER